MKLSCFSLFGVALLAAGVVQADDHYSFKEPFTETHPLAANGEISLENVNGFVEIRTWDKNEVRIEGEKSARTAEELGLIDLTIDPTPSSLTIKARLPRRPGSWFSGNTIRAQVRFTLTVPAGASLRQIETVNSAISIDGVRGLVNASTVNGSITVHGLSASTRLNTVNGSVRAEFASLGHDQSASIDTVNGGVTLSFPKGASFQMQAQSVNGSISCDFPIRLDGKTGRNHLRGTVGDGSASLKAATVNGSIHIKEL